MKLIPYTLSFFTGVLLFQFCKTLPDPHIFIFLPGLIFGAYIYRPCCLLLIFCLGFYTAFIGAYLLIYPNLKAELINQRLNITATIIKIYKQDHLSQKMLVRITDVKNAQLSDVPTRVQLNWYTGKTAINLNDECEFLVKLKPFYRLANPGSLDYEKLMFTRGINARGYILKGKCSPSSSRNSLRIRLINQFKNYQSELDYFPIMLALSYGDRSEMSRPIWDILRATGTAHLMAISGMHISVICFLSFFVIRQLVSMSANLCNLLPAQHYAAIAAFFICFFYAYLAGFSLPTQRALIMVTVGLCAILIYKPVFNMNSLCLALIIILIFAPQSVLLASFWFSFSAVFFIYLAIQLCRQSSYIKKYIFIQLYLSVALLPFSGYVFNEGSIISPVANLLAIPLVTFIVLPSLLITQLLITMELSISETILVIIDDGLRIMFVLLEMLAELKFSTLNYSPKLIEVILFELVLIVFSIGFATHHQFLKRYWMLLCCVLLIAALFITRSSVSKEYLKLTILDVGQGLSVLVETNSHTLLYDTGLKSRSGFNMGDAVIKPFLQKHNHKQIDKIIISHNDNDHIGGLETLLAGVQVKSVMFNQIPDNLFFSEAHETQLCHEQIQWNWGAVKFEILHPPQDWNTQQNNRSCVLKIRYFEHSILLTGDIYESVETYLNQKYGDKLRSDIMIAPHHGSQTSSSHSFINQVNPVFVIFSAGIGNRYGHPHSRVEARYVDNNVHILNTAIHGAISFKIYPKQAIQAPSTFQQQSKRYWHSTRKGL